jgi:hypothetical protein
LWAYWRYLRLKTGILGPLRFAIIKLLAPIRFGEPVIDLWPAYRKAAIDQYYSKPMLLSTGERKHTSLNMIKDRSRELEPARMLAQAYSDGTRYILAQDLTFDMVVSVYDVNSRSMIAARVSREPKLKDWEAMAKRLSTLKKPNLEVRIIGLQNGSSEMTQIIEELHRHVESGRLMEMDLFGTGIRHIAFDIKTGVSYNVLLLNRLYRAGELATQIGKDEFDKTRLDLVLV